MREAIPLLSARISEKAPFSSALPDRARLIDIERHTDERGTLLVPNPEIVPFPIKLSFMITHVPTGAIRGEHAHLKSKELLWCLHGNVRVTLDDGRSHHEFVLNSPTQALYIPAKTWISMTDFSREATLLAFSSETYDPNDYIRDYSGFLNLIDDYPGLGSHRN